jgi:hypothetical protein
MGQNRQPKRSRGGRNGAFAELRDDARAVEAFDERARGLSNDRARRTPDSDDREEAENEFALCPQATSAEFEATTVDELTTLQG